MRNFEEQVTRQIEKLNGMIQELNINNPAESRLLVCPECHELFNEEAFWDHEIECEQAPQDDPTDIPILSILKRHLDDFDHEPDRPRICADEKWRSRL